MPLACVGLSHHTAPLAVRERLAFGRDEVRAALENARDGELRSAGIAELALVSTCNRTELYAAAHDPAVRFSDAPALLTDVLIRSGRLPPDDIRPSLYTHASTQALRHLCAVATGLDSMILGEAEVLGQVATAHDWATQANASGPILEAAFRTAVRAGRRARVETGICRNPMSVASEAVRLIRELASATAAVLIVGTGEQARLLGSLLRSNGFNNLSVIGRNPDRAKSLVPGIGRRALPWRELGDALRETDIVLTSTAAPHAVIGREMVEAALGGRRRHELTFVDLAVPRDVDPQAGELPGVRLYDLDTLQQRLNGNLADRRQEVPRVEAIIEEEVTLFEAWRRGAQLRPVLSAMHARGEAIRRQEIERVLHRLSEHDPEVREEIEALSKALVTKLLHAPSTRLRSEIDPVRSRLYVETIQELFDLHLSSPSSADAEPDPA
ncbi:MAG TPA: glutamyl-tRNA reductase [Gemmatimonadales bacterium]